MDKSAVFRKTPWGAEILVQVTPNADASEISGYDEWRKRITVKIAAQPTEGRANRETENLFSSVTGYPASITAGSTSRRKTVSVKGDPEEIWRKISENF